MTTFNIPLASLSLAQLHSVLTQLSPEGTKVPKALRSVKDGVARIEGLGLHAVEIEATEDGVVAVGQAAPTEEPETDQPTPPEGIDPQEDAEEPGETGGETEEPGEGEGDEEPAEAPADAPFVKASKEELTAMDAATRATYRKNRRAAARKARKSKAA